MTVDRIVHVVTFLFGVYCFMGLVVLLARIWEALGEINAIHKKLFPEEYRSADEDKD